MAGAAQGLTGADTVEPQVAPQRRRWSADTDAALDAPRLLLAG
jgi:hypothetical protein